MRKDNKQFWTYMAIVAGFVLMIYMLGYFGFSPERVGEALFFFLIAFVLFKYGRKKKEEKTKQLNKTNS